MRTVRDLVNPGCSNSRRAFSGTRIISSINGHKDAKTQKKNRLLFFASLVANQCGWLP
jgi:hypothetical protein